jgi:hypothetical protein
MALFFIFAPSAMAASYHDIFSSQSMYQAINAGAGMNSNQGNGVIVAVLDSGVDIDHPDLKNNIWHNLRETQDHLDNDKNGYVDDLTGWDFVSNSSDPRPKFDNGYVDEGMDHGTAVSGIIVGLAPKAQIMPIRVLAGDGTGDSSNLVKAIKYAVNNGASIINLSLVGYDYSDELAKTTKWANDRGVIIVAASGNSTSGYSMDLNVNPIFPACYGDKNGKWVLAVSSLSNSGSKSIFSNYGSKCVNISAPGESLTSLAFYSPKKKFDNLYLYNYSGTSFASAVVTGGAALIKAQNPFWFPDQTIAALTKSAKNIDAENPNYLGKLGSGMVDIKAALNFVPSSTIGYLIKTANFPAVYFLDNSNRRHLFSNEDTFRTWYSGPWSEQNVKTVSQSFFDGLQVGSNVTVRPGSRFKFDNSSNMYVAKTNGQVCLLDKTGEADLYSASHFSGKISLIQTSFESDYIKDSSCQILAGSKYPDGSIIQYQNSSDYWYIDNGTQRKLTTEGFMANGFIESNVIKNVGDNFIYFSGQNITDWEKGIFPYKKT